ncbi:MAG TPA: diguanylate cyclase [bacterium]|nr:diguanylate cyclase [bacterium]
MATDAQASPSGFPWAPLAAGLAVAAVFSLSLSGHLAPLRLRLDLSSPGLSLALAFLALGPLAFYAFTLEREKPAPALRHGLTPWVLLACLHLGVQLSGGLVSPLWAAYPLLILLLRRQAGWFQAGLVTAALLALEGLPLWINSNQGTGSPWPGALALALPVAGLLLGGLINGKAPAQSAGRQDAVRAAAPPPKGGPKPAASNGAGSAAPVAAGQGPDLAGLGRNLEPEALLNRDLRVSLDMVFKSHPQFNSLSLWWGDGDGVELHYALLREGRAVAGARVEVGQGHLGHVLRSRKALSVEPLAASAAAGLPWVEGPYGAKALRVVPLNDEDRLIGLVACDKAQEEAFAIDEIGVLDDLGRLLTQHAQRAAKLQSLTAEKGRIDRLNGAFIALREEKDHAALLERFRDLLPGLVPADSWALGLREENHGALLRKASDGYAEDAPLEMSLDRSSAMAGSLAQNEGALLFNRSPGSQVAAVLQEGLRGEANHFLLVPLRVGKELIGVLKLDRHAQPFEEEDRLVANLFASQAALALEHTRLFSRNENLATTDGLTGLYNHRYFQERLATEIQAAERKGRPLTLALTDIDFFKKFNDTFGHQEGDVVLRKVAQLCQQQVRGSDIVCRYGGEEFVVILPECDVVEARAVMDRLRAYSATNLIGGSGPMATAITISIGLATFPQCGKEPREIIHAADEALYKAKHTGRNKVCSYKDL